MKTLKLTIFLLILTICSCKQEPKPVVDYTIISGKVENLPGGTIWMLNFDGWEKYINVKEDGTFLDTLHIEKPGAYIMDYGKKRSEIYLENNINIRFNFDAKDFNNSLKFEGDYASLNNHFAKKGIANDSFFSQMKEIYSLEIDACKKLLQENYVTSFLKSLEVVTGISDELRNLEKMNIQYGYLDKLGMFKFYHSRFADKKNYETPEWYNDEVTEFSKEDVASLYYSTEYYLRVLFHYMDEASKITEKDSTISFRDARLKTFKSIENESIRNTLLFRIFSETIATAENKKDKFDDYLATNTDASYKERAIAFYEQAIKLEPGRPSPKFVNYENHAGGTTSLDDFKGKYVYVDIWATWCGPCKRQIPFLEKIEAQYHGKNIEFVTISVDYKKDFDKWKQMVTKKHMKGIQLIAPDAFNSEFISAFNIQGIPRFILIDPEGNLITPNAPLPEQKELIDLFNKHEI